MIPFVITLQGTKIEVEATKKALVRAFPLIAMANKKNPSFDACDSCSPSSCQIVIRLYQKNLADFLGEGKEAELDANDRLRNTQSQRKKDRLG